MNNISHVYNYSLKIYCLVIDRLIFAVVTPDLVPGLTWGLTPNITRVSYPKIKLSLSSRWVESHIYRLRVRLKFEGNFLKGENYFTKKNR